MDGKRAGGAELHRAYDRLDESVRIGVTACAWRRDPPAGRPESKPAEETVPGKDSRKARRGDAAGEPVEDG